jgi:hypothetical protein
MSDYQKCRVSPVEARGLTEAPSCIPFHRAWHGTTMKRSTAHE